MRPKPRKRDLSARETMTSGPIQYSLLRMTTFWPFSLPRHRRDRAAAVFFEADDARFALRLVSDRHLAHAEELPDQDREQMRGAADAAGEDAGEALHRLDRRLVVDEQRRGPVAARHDARQVHHQADLQAGEIVAVDMPVVDADAGPGLAALFGRRMIAEREHAGAEHRATARQRHLAFQGPRFGQRFTPGFFQVSSSNRVQRPMGRERRQHEGDADRDQRGADDVGEALAGADLLHRHHACRAPPSRSRS